jgi:OTU domain-containing protein 3
MPRKKKQTKKQKQKKWEKKQQKNQNQNNNQNNNNNKNNNKINNYQKKKEKNQYRKKRNKRRDEIDEEFIKELEKLGYFIREVGGDGNCLFRSVSDQMDNTEKNYKEYRSRCIEYMVQNKDEFINFLEDDEPFDKYIQRMSEDGEWGGNLEIYALSRLLNANFYIYIFKQPMYVVNNFDKPKKNILMTYHDGKHYNSLRKLEEKSKEDKEKEEKRKKEKKEENEEDEKEENENDEEEEEDDNDDINDLISKVDHLNI